MCILTSFLNVAMISAEQKTNKRVYLIWPENVLTRHLRWCDGSVSLLSGCVPDLGLDGLALHVDAACGKLHPDGALTLQVKLIAGEAREQVTLAHTRVADQHHCGGRSEINRFNFMASFVRYCARFCLVFVLCQETQQQLQSDISHTQGVFPQSRFNNECTRLKNNSLFTHTGRLTTYW